MVSKCPSCAKEIEHEDFLFEVSCSCGMAFNPFYDANVAVNADSPESPEGQSEPVSANAPEFAEAADAFRDIVAFGEDSEEPKKPTESAAPDRVGTPTPAKTRSERAPSPSAGQEGVPSGDRILVSGEKLEGYIVESYLNPVSVSASVDWEAESPLDQAFDSIWNACTRTGGNALLFTRWELSPDGGRCLVAGVPVRCQKI